MVERNFLNNFLVFTYCWIYNPFLSSIFLLKYGFLYEELCHAIYFIQVVLTLSNCIEIPPIARFMGPTWYGANMGPVGPRWAPCCTLYCKMRTDLRTFYKQITLAWGSHATMGLPWQWTNLKEYIQVRYILDSYGLKLSWVCLHVILTEPRCRHIRVITQALYYNIFMSW